MKFLKYIWVRIFIWIILLSIYYFYVDAIKLSSSGFFIMFSFFMIGFLDVIIFNLLLKNKKIGKNLIYWFISLVGLFLLEGPLMSMGEIYKNKVYDINNVVYNTFTGKVNYNNNHIIKISSSCENLIKDGIKNKPKPIGNNQNGRSFEVYNTNGDKKRIILLMHNNKNIFYYFNCQDY